MTAITRQAMSDIFKAFFGVMVSANTVGTRMLAALIACLACNAGFADTPDYIPQIPDKIQIPPEQFNPGVVIPIQINENCQATGSSEYMYEFVGFYEKPSYKESHDVRAFFHYSRSIASSPGDSRNISCNDPNPYRSPAKEGSGVLEYKVGYSISITTGTQTQQGIKISAGQALAKILAGLINIEWNGSWTLVTQDAKTATEEEVTRLNVIAPAKQCWTRYSSLLIEDKVAFGSITTGKRIGVFRLKNAFRSYPETDPYIKLVTCEVGATVTGVAKKLAAVVHGVVSTDPCIEDPHSGTDYHGYTYLEHKKNRPACEGLMWCRPYVEKTCCKSCN